MSIEFIDLVVDHSATKVNFAEVDDAQLASEGYLSHPVLFMRNLEIQDLNVFTEVIDYDFIKYNLRERFVLYFEHCHLVMEANEKEEVEVL